MELIESAEEAALLVKLASPEYVSQSLRQIGYVQVPRPALRSGSSER
jgi:hypothetical protein